MQIHVEESRKLRRASAIIRDGGFIHVKVPRHWSRELKRSVIEELVERLQRKDEREKALLNSSKVTCQARVTISGQTELERYVRSINAETFNVPLGKIRLGNSRYNYLAQVNLQTKTMTVSKYCLHNVPAEALRYLIIHELAHYFESGHGPRFWALVEQHVPDYRLQSRIIKAFHHQEVIYSGQEAEPLPTRLPLEEVAAAGSSTKSRYVTKPNRKPPALPASSSTEQPKVKVKGNQPEQKPPHNKTGLIPGLVKQLLLWGSDR